MSDAYAKWQARKAGLEQIIETRATMMDELKEVIHETELLKHFKRILDVQFGMVIKWHKRVGKLSAKQDALNDAPSALRMAAAYFVLNENFDHYEDLEDAFMKIAVRQLSATGQDRQDEDRIKMVEAIVSANPQWHPDQKKRGTPPAKKKPVNWPKKRAKKAAS